MPEFLGLSEFNSCPCRLSNFCPPLCSLKLVLVPSLGPATTQNVVVKFDGEICGGVLVEDASDYFPSKRSSKISFQTSPEVRHQFRRKLRQLHSGNRWCLHLLLFVLASSAVFEIIFSVFSLFCCFDVHRMQYKTDN